MLFWFLPSLVPPSSQSTLAVAVFLDCSCKSLTVLKCEGYIFSPCCLLPSEEEGYIFFPCCLLPSEEDRIPPQTLESGAGVECCLEGSRTSGLESWSEDPQTVHCRRALNCLGSWRKAIKDQPRAGRILDQMLATSQKHRVDFWGRKDILLQSAEKNLLRLSQLFLLPSGDPCGHNQFPAFPGKASDWTPSRPPCGCRPSWLGLAGWVVLIHTGPIEINGEWGVRDLEGL